MRNILLINPWIYDFAAYDFWNKPIGLLFLGSFLRANGANVYFLDCLDPYHPDMCYKNLCGIPKRRKSGEGGYALVHRTFPGIPVILGGNYVTLYPHHAKKSGADFLLAGPAELSIPVLFKNLYNQDMRFIPDIDSLDSYPYPAFELISHPDHVPIMTSRGCPYHCSYCVSHILNSRFRRRDPIRVADEIHYWHTHLGIRHFSF